MSEEASIANGHTTITTETVDTPPEIEATLSRLSAYRNVRGVMIISRSTASGSSGGVVQSTGSVFEGGGGKKYARVVEGLASSVGAAVAEVHEGVSCLPSCCFHPRQLSCCPWASNDAASLLKMRVLADFRTSSSLCEYGQGGMS